MIVNSIHPNTSYISYISFGQNQKKKILKKLKAELKPLEGKFEHSLRVGETAKKLAQQYGVDPEKAALAGLLHDCAKAMPQEKLLSYVDENKNIGRWHIEQFEIDNPQSLHCPVSALLAETNYNINDEEVLDAIRYHSIGRVEMTPLDKVVMLADKIEPEKVKGKEQPKLIDKYQKISNEIEFPLIAHFFTKPHRSPVENPYSKLVVDSLMCNYTEKQNQKLDAVA